MKGKLNNMGRLYTFRPTKQLYSITGAAAQVSTAELKPELVIRTSSDTRAYVLVSLTSKGSRREYLAASTGDNKNEIAIHWRRMANGTSVVKPVDDLPLGQYALVNEQADLAYSFQVARTTD